MAGAAGNRRQGHRGLDLCLAGPAAGRWQPRVVQRCTRPAWRGHRRARAGRVEDAVSAAVGAQGDTPGRGIRTAGAARGGDRTGGGQCRRCTGVRLDR
ncbi:hypothetical protein G6F60_015061 [Rhizopus arrhizus]|nr:hypothetical protein G6F60_015061 [Rhizopus arrhizus]